VGRRKSNEKQPLELADVLQPARGKETQFQEAMASAFESLAARQEADAAFRQRLLGALQRWEFARGFNR